MRKKYYKYYWNFQNKHKFNSTILQSLKLNYEQNKLMNYFKIPIIIFCFS